MTNLDNNSIYLSRASIFVHHDIENEWWVIWGIIFVACPCHKGGSKLFQTEQPKGTAAPVIDMSIDKNRFEEATGAAGKKVISWSRFKTIKETFLHLAFDNGTNGDDPWHPISGLVDDFNDNRKRWIVPAMERVLDESMSNFQPRTTKSSKLPFLSYLPRKPKGLGTEFKVAACTVTGIICYLELQRGSIPMRLKSFHSDVGATAACSLRLTVGSIHCGLATKERIGMMETDQKHLILGDSWFGSVRLAEAIKLLRKVPELGNDRARAEAQSPMNAHTSFNGYIVDRTISRHHKGHELIAAVKTNSGWFPKKDIAAKMKNWPSGSHIVYECVAPETNVELVAIGYKYNSKKILYYIMTKNAGSTLEGKAYKAKFPDQYGNVLSRDVFRPEVLSTYFGASNLIDAHNHARQSLLGLEKYWITRNPWLRIIFTTIGMTVVDCWKALKYQSPQYGRMTIEDFANRLAFDCLNNGHNRSSTLGGIRGDITADGIGDTVSELSSRVDAMPSFLFGGAAVLAPNFQNMSINCCSGGINPSPLTDACSQQTYFNFQGPRKVEDHDIMRQRVLDSSGKPGKRKCVVCKRDTRNECSHRNCMKFQKMYAGIAYQGVPVCAKVRKELKSYGLEGNNRSCIQIHRAQCRGQQQETELLANCSV
jgi:Transposase IS4